MESPAPSHGRSGHACCVVAVVLGTALTAMTPASATARTPETTERAVGEISRYCTACWRNARLNPSCWGDCTQEVFGRLLERVDCGHWDRVLWAEGQERREFLRAIDAVKKRAQRQRKWSSLVADHVADRHDGLRARLADERDAVEQAAAELLSPRQQRILQMSFEGWNVQDVAEELSLSPERVSDEKYKAIRKLRAHLCPAGQTLD